MDQMLAVGIAAIFGYFVVYFIFLAIVCWFFYDLWCLIDAVLEEADE